MRRGRVKHPGAYHEAYHADLRMYSEPYIAVHLPSQTLRFTPSSTNLNFSSEINGVFAISPRSEERL
jgi:hypothetical protein